MARTKRGVNLQQSLSLARQSLWYREMHKVNAQVRKCSMPCCVFTRQSPSDLHRVLWAMGSHFKTSVTLWEPSDSASLGKDTEVKGMDSPGMDPYHRHMYPAKGQGGRTAGLETQRTSTLNLHLIQFLKFT